jgi:hypothetical protein
MSTRLAGRTILVKGVVLVLLAAVHVVGGLAIEPGSVAGSGTTGLRHDYIVYFCIAGVFFLFMGIVDLLCCRSLGEGVGLAWRISMVCSLFTAIVGLAGVSIFGVSPPLVLLVVGVMGSATLVLANRERQPA